jgi:hypothetical protein
MPNVVPFDVNMPLRGQQMEGGELQVVERVDWPTIVTVCGDESANILVAAAVCLLDLGELRSLVAIETPRGLF